MATLTPSHTKVQTVRRLKLTQVSWPSIWPQIVSSGPVEPSRAHFLIANLMAFLTHLGVPTVKTAMTFGVSRDHGTFEWAGTSLSSIFAQKRNLFNLQMWKLIFDIIRFNEFALDLLRADGDRNPIARASHPEPRIRVEESIGDYLDREGYSQMFRDDYLIPVTASVWGVTPGKYSPQCPAITFVRLMWNHHLLGIMAKGPDWRIINGGLKQYIDAVMKDIPLDRVHVKTKITAVVPTQRGTVVVTANGRDQEYDHVILATHGDQAFEILQPVATKEEIDILGSFQTRRNIAVLHSDVSLMPKRRIAWSARNYLTESPFPPTGSANVSKVCLTYWMNLLQHIPEHEFGPVLVTLNPLNVPDPRLAQGIWEYSHSLYNNAVIKSQQLLPKIQNTRNISYCGAWTKYGSHEDGFRSGLAVAVHHLGAHLPFELVDSALWTRRKPVLSWGNYMLRIVILAIQITALTISLTSHLVLKAAARGSHKTRKGRP